MANDEDSAWDERLALWQEKLGTLRSQVLVSALERTAIDAVGGGALFLGGVSLTHLGMYVLRISVAMPVLPSLLGGLGVASSSAMAGAFCLRHGSTEPTPLQLTAAATSGLLLFRLLGGRFRALAPSDFRHPGAFGHARISLPATIEYADGNARAVIQSFGRLYGCHTCGTKRSKYHADHMPPVLVAKAENARVWAKLFGPVTQRYYPQCESCSNTQGALVKKNAKQLKLHLTELRAYHWTGFWMVLFGASGLGGFFAQASDEAPSVVEHVVAQATDAVQKPLLLVLRDREARLRERRQTETNKEARQAIDDELATIRARKADIKKAARRN
ncbi:hypothetical protein SPRG_04145 [Saprolegnia parasitica CBS 223.65]|uniref:Uncharacterized protein n=1 Tax=Saprolegnia parasitica (strain CBS 223.65) TaxID=695850 RepID=A0A067CVX6_SAPPC|nr:hypothetical protein SPRG_04145 [Saprolegnia parasitica CBS 223.65]KDO30957.1 hypothetical protein SPRG_04145 [Saprolegnia parasitica CBS 223.65]|eukprot:XP_012198141.1 hypothetical protein SPRG_04145 [Saprolegnia parasitica CBS 223.65]